MGMNGRKSESWWVPLIFAVAVFGIWGLTWLLTTMAIGPWDSRGQFGDMFGSANTLFSGLALAGIIYAILLQKRELGLQRQELKHTREVLARTAQSQHSQSKLLASTGRMSAAIAAIEMFDRTAASTEHYNPMPSETDDIENWRGLWARRLLDLWGELEVEYSELEHSE